MRTRDEIEKEIERQSPTPLPVCPEGSTTAFTPRIIPINTELLLDIRDLLANKDL